MHENILHTDNTCTLYESDMHTFTNTVSPQSHHSLELLAKITNKTITKIMEPHREIFADMIPPKKHLLKHQPISTQIALMDGWLHILHLSNSSTVLDRFSPFSTSLSSSVRYCIA